MGKHRFIQRNLSRLPRLLWCLVGTALGAAGGILLDAEKLAYGGHRGFLHSQAGFILLASIAGGLFIALAGGFLLSRILKKGGAAGTV